MGRWCDSKVTTQNIQNFDFSDNSVPYYITGWDKNSVNLNLSKIIIRQINYNIFSKVET